MHDCYMLTCKNIFFLSVCLLISYLGQFKHGSQGKLILNKVIFHISIISQISKSLNSPLPCFGIYLGITEPPRSRKKEIKPQLVMMKTVGLQVAVIF